MADSVVDNSRRWKLATAALAVLALGAATFGYVQYRAAGKLGAQLAAATDDAELATSEETKLRSQLSAEQDRVNSQGQKLTAAAEQVGTEQRQLAVAEQEVSAEQRQLAAARQQVSSERQQLAAAQQQVSEEQRELQSTRAELAAQSRQDMPIRLTFHDAISRAGKVALLQNLSDQDLEVLVEAQNPATGAKTQQRLMVSAHGATRFGPAQGWPFTAGQLVRVSNPRYRPIVQTVS